MTFYNFFTNLNTNYFDFGLNNWFSPFNNVFTPNFTSLFTPISFNFNNFNTTSIFPVNSWSTASNNFQNYNFSFSTSSNTDTFQRTTERYGNGQLGLVRRAESFVGQVNSDREGNRLFSNGRSEQWCADFASYNVYDTFGRSKMKSLGFPDTKAGPVSSCAIWNWGKGQSRQISLRGSSNKKETIAQQVKPGDIMILCRGSYTDNPKSFWAGHTAIVSKVNADGSFETIDGNSKDAVRRRTHTNPPSNIVGFVRMDNLA